MGSLDEFKTRQSSQKASSLPSGEVASSGLDAFKTNQPPAEPERIVAPVGELSLGASVGRGVDILKANFQSLIGEFEDAETTLKEADPASIPSFRQVEGIGTGAQFITERTLESLPSTGLGLLGAGLGFLTPIPGGTILGAAIGSGLPLLGESRRELKERGGEGGLLEAAAPAAINTAMEVARIGQITKALGVNKIFKEAVEGAMETPAVKTLLKKTVEKGKDVVIQAGSEGLVEASQEFNNMVAGDFFANKEVLALPEEDQDRLLEAFFGGVGGGLGQGVISNVAGVGIDKVAEIRKNVKLNAFKESAEGALREAIKQKKVSIEEADAVLTGAASRWEPDTRFRIFKGLGGFFSTQSRERGTSLPIGKTGFGPAAFIYGHNIPKGTPVHQRVKGFRVSDTEGNKVPWSSLNEKSGVFFAADGLSETPFTFIEGESTTPKELQGEVASYLRKAMDKLGIENNIVLGDMSQSASFFTGREKATYEGSNGGDFGSYEGLGGFMGLDYIGALTKADSKEEALAALLEVASHELGHAVISKQWGTMPDNIKNGLLQGYRDWLTDIESLTIRQFSEKYNSPHQHKRQMLVLRNPDKSLKSSFRHMAKRESTRDAPAYLTSFDEYAAQMMNKALTGNIKDVPVEARTFMEKTLKLLKDLWTSLKELSPATPTFQAWVDGLTYRKEVAEMEAILDEINNPSGERKKTLSGLNTFFKENGEGQTPPSYIANEPSMLADLLQQAGLEHEAEDMREHQDVTLGFMRLATVLTPLQLAELAKQAGINNPQRYMDLVKAYSNTKMKQVVQADEIAQKWRALGNTKSTQLSNFLFAVSDHSDTKERRLSPEELETFRGLHSVDDETFAMWEEIDQSFRSTLDGIESGLVLDAAKSFIQDAGQAQQFRDLYIAADSRQRKLQLIEDFTGLELIVLEGDRLSNPLFDELNRINASISKLRQRNYFPRTRMGQYTVTIRSTDKDQEWEGHTSKKAGQTLGYYSFESKRERDAMLNSLKAEAEAEGLSISGSIADTEVFAMMGMPEVLIQNISADPKLNLSAEQQQQLKDVSLNLSPGKRFLRHLKKRRGIVGFNRDALRVYSNYMMSAANHLARVEHSKSMVQALQTFKDDIRRLEDTNLGGDIGDLVKLKNYFNRHFDYLMKPDNDWAQLRSIGFLWYLGFNVKSALVNLTQIPMVTYPVLAGRYGDAKSTKALAAAYKDVTLHLKSGTLPADEVAMFQELRDTGILDESMVMELAGMGEADVLKRAIPGWDFDNLLNKVAYYGGGMFRLAEKYNRHVTALSAYRLARDAGQTNPVDVAREVIEKSQFEYSKWNRAEFMRGKRSVIFLFWQYMQHASFLFFGGEGSKVAMRMWLLALFIAGVEGLPFAATLIKAIDFGGTSVGKALGVANPRVSLEEDMRTLLLDLTDKPDLILNGMASQWGLGPLHLLTLMGAPIPNIDIGGSLSFGSPVQFLDEALGGSGNPDEELGKFTAAFLGPVGAMGIQAYRSASSTDPDTWKRVEKIMPVFFKNAMQGGRWLSEGKETFRGGGEFLNMDRPEHRVGAVMKGLGFQSTRITQKYKQTMAIQDAALFWTNKKSLLLEDYAYALQTKDREAKKDVMVAIKKHNKALKEVKHLRGLAISSKDMRRSIQSRQRSIKQRELGIAQSAKQQPLFKEFQKLFPVSD